VISCLKFVGTANAALWFGATLFFSILIGPALFSPDMYKLFGWPATGATAKYWAGSVAQILLERFFWVQCWCGAFAVAHRLIEWLASGRPIQRTTLALLLGLLSLALAGGFWLQPQLRHLHKTMYGVGERVTVEQAQKARTSFARWHGVSQGVNLVILGGLAFYLWQITQGMPGQRFVGQSKFSWE
jgi:hypothetical protein